MPTRVTTSNNNRAKLQTVANERVFDEFQGYFYYNIGMPFASRPIDLQPLPPSHSLYSIVFIVSLTLSSLSYS